jgi:hypothetical protein
MTGKNPVEKIKRRLTELDVTKREEVGGESYSLRENIKDLRIENGELKGTFEFDELLSIKTRGRVTYTKITHEAPFRIVPYNDENFYIIVTAHGKFADKLAHSFSMHLFRNISDISRTFLTEECLQEIYDDTGSVLKYCGWDSLDIPGLSKSSLAGTDNLEDTRDYDNYNRHGKRSRLIYHTTDGKTICITKRGSVTCFSEIEEDELVDFVKRNILNTIDRHIQLLNRLRRQK